MVFDLSKSSAKEMGFNISNAKGEFVRVGYDVAKKEFYVDRRKSGKTAFSQRFAQKHTAPYVAGKILTIRALIDNSSVEVFVDNGRIVFTDLFFPNEDFTKLDLFSAVGQTQLVKAEVHDLKSIW